MTLSSLVSAVWHSRLFWSIAVTYVLANLMKLVVRYYKHRSWDPAVFVYTGGMPSAHTATTTALTIALAFETGASPVFFLAALFTIITIRDSYGVRRAVSDQADIINSLVSEMKLRKKAKIVLGHTPFQVFVGFILGCLVALGLYLL